MHEYLKSAISKIIIDLGPVPDDISIEFETPANPEHGDLATNVAMRLAKPFKKAPRAIAEEIADRLDGLPLDSNRIAGIEGAGPGFLD
ncbi:MAG: arginine--tRNA ligase, partial [Rhodothermia bacterium]